MKRTILTSLLLAIAVVSYAQRGAPRRPAGAAAAPPRGAARKHTRRRSMDLYNLRASTRIKVSVVTKGLSHPWSIAWLPNGDMLITERAGQLRIVRNGVLDPTPIDGVPKVQAGGTSGLLDIALHPKFATNGLVYMAYNTSKPAPRCGADPGTGPRQVAAAAAASGLLARLSREADSTARLSST